MDKKTKRRPERSKLLKHRQRLTGLLTDKLFELDEALEQFSKYHPYVILKKEEKQALKFAIKLINKELDDEQSKTQGTDEAEGTD